MKIQHALLVLIIIFVPDFTRADLAYQFNGIITDVSDPDSILPPSIFSGASFNGLFGYSTDVVDSDPHPQFGDFRYEQPLSNAIFTVTFGGQTFNPEPTLPLFISTQNVQPFESGPDMFQMGGALIPPIGDADWVYFQIEVSDYNNRTALSDDGLPSNLADPVWDSRVIFLLGNSGKIMVYGEIQNIQAVPEPSVMALYVTGLLFITSFTKKIRPTCASSTDRRRSY